MQVTIIIIFTIQIGTLDKHEISFKNCYFSTSKLKYELIFQACSTLSSDLTESWYDELGLLFCHPESNLVPDR